MSLALAQRQTAAFTATRGSTRCFRPRCSPPTSKRTLTISMAAGNFHDFKTKKLNGEDLSFNQYKGKVLLVTNVACQCGLTNSNYKELVQLHDKYNTQGLEIVAFPCNQFGAQEPGSPQQIQDFVSSRFGAQFTMTEKVDVNGPKTHPIWQFLKGACSTCAGDVRWNFGAKFLIDKEGTVVERNGDSPMASEAKIKELLAA